MKWSVWIQYRSYWLMVFYIIEQHDFVWKSSDGMFGRLSARMEETSMNEIKSIKQYSKLISIELSWMNDKVAWHFEVLEYLNTINIQYSEILSNVTERGYSKLHPPELIMDVRFGRSTFHHFKPFHCYFALSMNMRSHHFFHKVHLHRV